MNLASNTAPVASTPYQGVAAIHPRLACFTRRWRDDLSRVGHPYQRRLSVSVATPS
jgi:hypothetical protein